MLISARVVIIVLLISVAPSVQTGELSQESAKGSERTGLNPEAAKLVVKQLSEYEYQIGEIRINALERTLSFPGEINMTEGNVEYMVTTAFGKTHESVFITDTLPKYLHVGILLISRSGEIPPPLNLTARELPKGYPVKIEVEWMDNGRARRSPIFRFIKKTTYPNRISTHPWIYTSSRLREKLLLADRDGSIVSIMEDLNSLVNISHRDRIYDDIWVVNTKIGNLVLGDPVKLIISLGHVKKSEKIKTETK